MIRIVVPCYNCENTIKSTMDSLCNQVGNIKYQIVMVDDGSTDATSGICDDLAEKRNTIR